MSTADTGMADEAKRRIGLLGGSFDPPHAGHVALAVAARDALGLDAVRFIPSAASPSPTKPAAVASGAQRLAMVRLAIGGEAAFEVDSLEIDRKGCSYTIDTLRELASLDAELVLLVGSDRAMTVERWVGFAEMRRLCRFAAAVRGGEKALLPDWFEAFPMPELILSSTTVRERIGRGLPVDTMVAPAVLAYIRAGNLYA